MEKKSTTLIGWLFVALPLVLGWVIYSKDKDIDNYKHLYHKEAYKLKYITDSLPQVNPVLKGAEKQYQETNEGEVFKYMEDHK